MFLNFESSMVLVDNVKEYLFEIYYISVKYGEKKSQFFNLLFTFYGSKVSFPGVHPFGFDTDF